MSDIFKRKINEPLGALLIWSLPCFLLQILAWAGLAVGHEYLPGPDFVNFWIGAKLAIHGKTASLYSKAGFPSAVHHVFPADRLGGGGGAARVFSYPPTMLALVILFGLLPYTPAFILWSLAGTGCLILALRANRFCKLKTPALALAAFCPAALFNLISGQNGAFTAALFLGGVYLSESAPLTAGVLFGLLTAKPHLGILIPPVLLLRRNWKCIASASTTAASLAAVSVLAWGLAPWREYATVIIPFQTSLLDRALLLKQTADSAYDLLMPGPYVDLAMVPGIKFPWLFYGMAAFYALFVSLYTVKREGLTARSVLALALATLIVTPYGYNYDMIAIMGALVVYLATLTELALPAHLVFGLLWILPAGMFAIKRIPLPLSSAIMLAALTCIHIASRKLAAAMRDKN